MYLSDNILWNLACVNADFAELLIRASFSDIGHSNMDSINASKSASSGNEAVHGQSTELL